MSNSRVFSATCSSRFIDGSVKCQFLLALSKKNHTKVQLHFQSEIFQHLIVVLNYANLTTTKREKNK